MAYMDPHPPDTSRTVSWVGVSSAISRSQSADSCSSRSPGFWSGGGAEEEVEAEVEERRVARGDGRRIRVGSGERRTRRAGIRRNILGVWSGPGGGLSGSRGLRFGGAGGGWFLRGGAPVKSIGVLDLPADVIFLTC